MSRPLLFIAASGLARETAEAARAAGREVLGCLDDDAGRLGCDIGADLQVLGGLEAILRFPEPDVVVCAGKGQVRARLVKRLLHHGLGPGRFGDVTHPSVDIPASARTGQGFIALAGCVLTSSISLGGHVVCMPNVTLTHDDVIGDFATLCAGVTLGGGVTVGRNAYLGMGSSVREGCAIGEDATVGMGSVVITDVPSGSVWAGNPARPIRSGSPAENTGALR